MDQIAEPLTVRVRVAAVGDDLMKLCLGLRVKLRAVARIPQDPTASRVRNTENPRELWVRLPVHAPSIAQAALVVVE